MAVVLAEEDEHGLIEDVDVAEGGLVGALALVVEYGDGQIKNDITKFKTEKEIKEWFEKLGISDKLESKAGRMSFGQQQRVAMIRALVQPFDFILADEPISHLNDKNSEAMAEIMMDEAKRQGAGVIVTSIGKHMELKYDKTYRL